MNPRRTSTSNLVLALRILACIESCDEVASLVIAEAANRLEELTGERRIPDFTDSE